MNRADKMLSVLRLSEGWWSRNSIFTLSGTYFLTNNAAAELRSRGYDVEHRRQGRTDLYRLVTR